MAALDSAKIIQGTIVAAAVINEIIAVIMAKKVLSGQERFIKQNQDNQKFKVKHLDNKCIYHRNDEYKYREVATQNDFDMF